MLRHKRREYTTRTRDAKIEVLWQLTLRLLSSVHYVQNT